MRYFLIAKFSDISVLDHTDIWRFLHINNLFFVAVTLYISSYIILHCKLKAVGNKLLLLLIALFSHDLYFAKTLFVIYFAGLRICNQGFSHLFVCYSRNFSWIYKFAMQLDSWKIVKIKTLQIYNRIYSYSLYPSVHQSDSPLTLIFLSTAELEKYLRYWDDIYWVDRSHLGWESAQGWQLFPSLVF